MVESFSSDADIRSDMLSPGTRRPVRMCVGCRGRGTKIELVRVVAGEVQSGRRGLKADPTGAASGRGAYLHPDLTCLQAAQRRRAFGRALRVAEALDDTELVEHFARLSTGDGALPSGTPAGSTHGNLG